MTTREAFVFGWVYGHIESKLPKTYDEARTKLLQASRYPLAGFGEINRFAIINKALSATDNSEIMLALEEIDAIDDYDPLPLEQQGSWQLGYFKGKSGRPLPAAEFDIKIARVSKKLSQAQLADMMGVDQAVISRWESGISKPNASNLAKLREILS